MIIDKKESLFRKPRVEVADEVVVKLADGREFEATEIKTDKQTDCPYCT